MPVCMTQPLNGLHCRYDLLRKIATNIREYSFKAKGSGKSGLHFCYPAGTGNLKSQCMCHSAEKRRSGGTDGDWISGKRKNHQCERTRKDFIRFPAGMHQKDNVSKIIPERRVRAGGESCRRSELYPGRTEKQKNLVAFVANGAILPRKSGVSMQPMKDAVSFESPQSMEVTMELPHHGAVKGMGLKKGITLIVGGGYHGKSTLLKALESGVYNHIAGDGREYVITDDSAVKLRAEDGRSIQKADISMFIKNLPNGKNTTEFYTEDASGSTSQAANTVEAMEAGSTLFLIDEDTSATNFMIRDELMQRVVESGRRADHPIY